MTVELDNEAHKVYLNLRAEAIISALNDNPEGVDSIWHPEYAKFMLECKRLNDNINIYLYFYHCCISVSVFI